MNTKAVLDTKSKKQKIEELREEHQPYFDINNISEALYIPKLAYRPIGKDDLHISFFPSELKLNSDIYTEFVSSTYETEDPKRTLYLVRYNPYWADEYELIKTNSGFDMYLIPVSELKIINDVTTRNNENYFKNKPSDKIETSNVNFDELINVLKDINETLKQIELKL